LASRQQKSKVQVVLQAAQEIIIAWWDKLERRCPWISQLKAMTSPRISVIYQINDI
jgi:hypothetical protein